MWKRHKEYISISNKENESETKDKVNNKKLLENDIYINTYTNENAISIPLNEKKQLNTIKGPIKKKRKILKNTTTINSELKEEKMIEIPLKESTDKFKIYKNIKDTKLISPAVLEQVANDNRDIKLPIRLDAEKMSIKNANKNKKFNFINNKVLQDIDNKKDTINTEKIIQDTNDEKDSVDTPILTPINETLSLVKQIYPKNIIKKNTVKKDTVKKDTVKKDTNIKEYYEKTYTEAWNKTQKHHEEQKRLQDAERVKNIYQQNQIQTVEIALEQKTLQVDFNEQELISYVYRYIYIYNNKYFIIYHHRQKKELEESQKRQSMLEEIHVQSAIVWQEYTETGKIGDISSFLKSVQECAEKSVNKEKKYDIILQSKGYEQWNSIQIRQNKQWDRQVCCI